MQKINTIKRLSMLIEKLEGNRYPSMQDFVVYFENSGYSVFQRTIEHVHISGIGRKSNFISV